MSDETKVVMGKMIKVANQNKKASENERYVSIQVEDESGDNERCLLFTEYQILGMEKVIFPWAMGEMKSGRLYNAEIDGKSTFLLKVKDVADKEMILRVSKTQVQDAESRSKRNPEDLTKKGWLTDMMD